MRDEPSRDPYLFEATKLPPEAHNGVATPVLLQARTGKMLEIGRVVLIEGVRANLSLNRRRRVEGINLVQAIYPVNSLFDTSVSPLKMTLFRSGIIVLLVAHEDGTITSESIADEDILDTECVFDVLCQHHDYGTVKAREIRISCIVF